jgi:hypothetical protein
MSNLADTLPALLDPTIVNVASYDPVLVYCLGGITLLWMVFLLLDTARRRMI